MDRLIKVDVGGKQVRGFYRGSRADGKILVRFEEHAKMFDNLRKFPRPTLQAVEPQFVEWVHERKFA